VTLAPSSYIDVYIYKKRDIDSHRKLLQFRLLAYINATELEGIEDKFLKKFEEEQKSGNPEHCACHIVSCTSKSICEVVFDQDYNFMDSTKASILEHHDSVRRGYYNNIQ
jgi:hypothetical protein